MLLLSCITCITAYFETQMRSCILGYYIFLRFCSRHYLISVLFNSFVLSGKSASFVDLINTRLKICLMICLLKFLKRVCNYEVKTFPCFLVHFNVFHSSEQQRLQLFIEFINCILNICFDIAVGGYFGSVYLKLGDRSLF